MSLEKFLDTTFVTLGTMAVLIAIQWFFWKMQKDGEKKGDEKKD